MARTAHTLVLLAAVLLTGCDRASRWSEPWPSDAERTVRDDYAPTPFTAEQIRRGCPEGRRTTSQVGGPDEKPHLQVFSFRDCDEKGCRFELQTLSPDGKVLRPTRTSGSTWEGLQSHASFPRSATTIERETLHLAPGWFHCMRYTIDTPDAPAGTYVRMWFARELPGPPVLMEQYASDKLTFRMVLLRHELAPSADG